MSNKKRLYIDLTKCLVPTSRRKWSLNAPQSNSISNSTENITNSHQLSNTSLASCQLDLDKNSTTKDISVSSISSESGVLNDLTLISNKLCFELSQTCHEFSSFDFTKRPCSSSQMDKTVKISINVSVTFGSIKKKLKKKNE